MNNLLSEEILFRSYSLEHVLSVCFGIALGYLIIFKTKHWTYLAQRKLLLSLTIFIALFQLLKVPIKIMQGVFDPTLDLPLHLCHFLPFFLIYIFYFLNRNLWAILFFWVVLGCTQASITPTLIVSLFNWDALRYWTLHFLIVIVTLYPMFNWKWELKFSDVWKTIVGLNVVALVIYLINVQLGSNYMYLNAKPPGKNLYAFFPEWPYFILIIEVILIVFSHLLYFLYKYLLGLKPKNK